MEKIRKNELPPICFDPQSEPFEVYQALIQHVKANILRDTGQEPVGDWKCP